MKGYRGLLALLLAGLGSVPGWSQEPDPAEVKRRMEIYMRDDPAETKKSAPAPKPRPIPAVDHDREAWQSAEKCGKTACFEAYLEDYPKGRYARMARARLKAEPDAQPAAVTEQPAPAARRTNQRFTDNGNGTVTDNQSGLIWLKDANCFDKQDWSTAMNLAKRLQNGQCGLRDGSAAGQWRLPSEEEWEALIDKTSDNPALPAGHPFAFVQFDYYWSSTTYTGNTSDAWNVVLNVGHMSTNAKKYTNYVWPVRDGR